MLGQSVTVHDVGYGCTEGLRGKALNFGDAGDFFIEIEDIVEFLDVTDKQTTDSIVQAVSTISLHIHASNATSFLPFSNQVTYYDPN